MTCAVERLTPFKIPYHYICLHGHKFTAKYVILYFRKYHPLCFPYLFKLKLFMPFINKKVGRKNNKRNQPMNYQHQRNTS